MRIRWTAAILADRLNQLRRYRRDSTDFAIIEPGQPSSKLVETICAFANLPHGGTVIFGVSEIHNYRVVGVKNVDTLVGHVTDLVRRNVTPSPFIDFHPLEFAGTFVLIVEVRGLPTSLPVARCARLPYLRDHNGNYLLSPTELTLLEANKRGDYQTDFDATEIAFTSIKDLNPTAVAQFVNHVRLTRSDLSPLYDDREVLTSCGVFGPAGSLTVAGAYLLGNYPQAMYPQLKISAITEFHQATRQVQDFDGSVPEMLEQAITWVKHNTPHHVKRGNYGQIVRECVYPIHAVREFLVNALVHRDLKINRPVELTLKDDRLIISSPGGLKEASLEQLTSPRAISHPVNPGVFALAQQLDPPLLNAEGMGAKTALWTVRDAMLVAPSVVDTGVEVTVTFYNVSAFTEAEVTWLESYAEHNELSTIDQNILIGLRRGEKWNTSRLLAEYPSYTYREINRMVDRLTSLGLITVADIGDFSLQQKYRAKHRKPVGDEFGGKTTVQV